MILFYSLSRSSLGRVKRVVKRTTSDKERRENLADKTWGGGCKLLVFRETWVSSSRDEKIIAVFTYASVKIGDK